MWKGTAIGANSKQGKKQVRKPVSNNFAPKRLAINFQPPTIILQYLVIDTGKLYHHKMRLDSILRKVNVTRNDVLNYIKTKHHLYFMNTKLKDEQILKFIDKILIKTGKASSSSQLTKIEQKSKHLESSPSRAHQQGQQQQQGDDDFDYLNDDDQYQEDYEDYQQEPKQAPSNAYKPTQVNGISSSFTTKTLQKPTVSPQGQNNNKNTFMTYCQEEYDDENQEEQQGQANWDLDIDQNADFDFV